MAKASCYGLAVSAQCPFGGGAPRGAFLCWQTREGDGCNVGRWYAALVIGFIAGGVIAAAIFAITLVFAPSRAGEGAVATGPPSPFAGGSVTLPLAASVAVLAGVIALMFYVRKEAVRDARGRWEQERVRHEMDSLHRLEKQRHDFFNQLTVISALLQIGATERCIEYVHRMLDPDQARQQVAGEDEGEGSGHPGEDGSDDENMTD